MIKYVTNYLLSHMSFSPILTPGNFMGNVIKIYIFNLIILCILLFCKFLIPSISTFNVIIISLDNKLLDTKN